ncbi:MAG: class I SAM-dependent methyltransferase [Chromatiaceae bacterium]|nr:class I SAM-dependent methyltransferase [candidate division KSB1 bacterium]MCP5416039.1 class I SAM-dependent methyltransferase [Chromatiaceae bacterium]
MQDTWQSGDPYEFYMGRWSKLVAEQFVDWLSPEPGRHWLDVGCGSGALSAAVIDRHAPKMVTAIDQSDGFVNTTQQRLGSNASCKVGNALSLPLDNASMDIAVSGLVLNFIPEPEKALKEMQRVTRSGGTVAIYVWDYAGKMDFLNHFWDAVVEINPHASDLHEGQRFPDCTAEKLLDVFNRVGFSQVEVAPIEIFTHFKDFDDYWRPFLGGQGPAPTYVSELSGTERDQLRKALVQRIPVDEDGSIILSARAWASKGFV